MKVPFIHGPNDVRLDEVPIPRPGPADVLVRVAVVGVCGSDLGYIKLGGVTGPGYAPMPLGHELSGIVEAVGTEVCSVTAGQRVIVNPMYNFIGNGGPEGGFAELLLVRDVAARPGSLVVLPDEISADLGALVEPLAVAAHGVNRLAPPAGAQVAVFGAGPIGLSVIASLRRRGVEDIVVFDLSQLRRQRALSLDARVAADPREHGVADLLREAHGTITHWGAPLPATTHYLEASGAPSVIPTFVEIARPLARLTIVSVQKHPVSIDFRQVLARELSIDAAMGYPTEFAEVLDLIRAGTIDLSPMVTHRFTGSEVLDAFAMADRQDEAVKVLVDYR